MESTQETKFIAREEKTKTKQEDLLSWQLTEKISDGACNPRCQMPLRNRARCKGEPCTLKYEYQ